MRLRSSLSDVTWPAVPSGAANTLLAVLRQLDDSQWWTAARIREAQLDQLHQLARFAADRLPFWKKRLRRAGWSPDQPMTWEQFTSLPILARETVQARAADLTAAPPEGHGRTQVLRTSGSTGRPVEVTRTELANVFWHAVALREHGWHQRDLSGKLAVIRHVADPAEARPPAGARDPDWGAPAATVAHTGPSVRLAIRSDLADQVAWLRREDPDYLLSYPSNLAGLAERIVAQGWRPGRLREVRTISEMLTPAVRATIEAAFGVPVVDLYSTQEVGLVALQVPGHRHLAAQAETIVVEVLDAAGRPCAPGEVGRVVVTPLHNFATVLFRYDVGDYAEVGPPSPCGRGLPVLTRVLGRVRNLLRYPDGRTAWPVFHDSRFRGVAPVRQYQVRQTALDRLELRLVGERPITSDEREQLAGIVRARLGHPFEVDVVQVPAIERDASGKFEDFRSEL